MRAMILAAGRGERLRPLTDHTPKPLLEVGGRSLIAHHLLALARAGVTEVVVNVAWLAGDIQTALGDGREFGVRIRYSVETLGRLDTGGGVRAALPLLGSAPFLLLSADIWTDFNYADLLPLEVPANGMHAILVDNPEHHPHGDFGLQNGRLVAAGARMTYAGMGVYAPELFAGGGLQRLSLAAVMRTAVRRGTALGTHYAGRWFDVGRPASLASARVDAAVV